MFVSLLTVWSDDDWLKKFSGKTTEEAEGAEPAAEATNTATQEVKAVVGCGFSKVHVRCIFSLKENQKSQSSVVLKEIVCL